MEYKKIENLVYQNNLIKRENYSTKKEYDLKLDTMLIENLKKCIEKNITINMDENDLAKIYFVYLKLLKCNYNIDKDFIMKIIDLSERKLDYFDIIENITE